MLSPSVGGQHTLAVMSSVVRFRLILCWTYFRGSRRKTLQMVGGVAEKPRLFVGGALGYLYIQTIR